jgi:hypothetical protein
MRRVCFFALTYKYASTRTHVAGVSVNKRTGKSHAGSQALGLPTTILQWTARLIRYLAGATHFKEVVVLTSKNRLLDIYLVGLTSN